MNDYSNIIIAISTAVGVVISISRLLNKKFDKIDARFDKIDIRFDKIVDELKEMRKEMANFDKRILTTEINLDHIDPNLKLHKDEEPKEN